MSEEKTRHLKAFEEFKEVAKEGLGESLSKLVLYGSVAHVEETEESHVAVFTVFDSREDLEMLRALVFEVGVMENGVSIFVQGGLSDSLEGFSETSLLRDLDRGGVKYA